MIVFVSTADQANYLQYLLKSFKTPAFEFEKRDLDEPFFKRDNIMKIHGHLEQKDRSRVFADINYEQLEKINPQF